MWNDVVKLGKKWYCKNVLQLIEDKKSNYIQTTCKQSDHSRSIFFSMASYWKSELYDWRHISVCKLENGNYTTLQIQWVLADQCCNIFQGCNTNVLRCGEKLFIYLGFSVGACGQQVLPLGLFGYQLEAVQHCCFAQTACQSRTTLKGRPTTRESV